MQHLWQRDFTNVFVITIDNKCSMKRCYFCGKSLPEIPSRCLRCGNIFCSDHVLPENHYCFGDYKHYCEKWGRIFLSISSKIVLSIGEKIKKDFNNIFLKTKNGNYGFPLPKISFAVLGMLVVSVLIIGITTSLVLSDNTTSVTQFFNISAKDPQDTPSDSQNYETGATSRSLKYVLRGESGSINMKMYSGVYDELSSRPSPVACQRYGNDNSACNNVEMQQYYLQYLDDPLQKKELGVLVHLIEFKTTNQDDRARIAISLVQNIPYNYTKFYSTIRKTSSPYAVLYENTGVCGEKSLLLAYLLRELGYGIVLFSFESENHMAVGVKSPLQYSYKNSGFAFIESTTPSIPTDSQGDYVTVGKLTSIPEQYTISDGSVFSSISEEYQDSIAYDQLRNSGELGELEKIRQWEMLVKKYGLISQDWNTLLKNPYEKSLCDGGRVCNGRCSNKCTFGSLWVCMPEGPTCVPII